MDRGLRNNLGIVEEEEDEEENSARSDGEESDDESEPESDDEAEEGTRRGEPTKFDNLCDGVLSAIALVNDSLQELLELKDEMLKHSLPPTLLIQTAMISNRLFRSISDLGMPVEELVRLVRVYATPWEEKSAALKKLHEDYDSKQRQLNIAIKRLQLVDAHSKRIAREKRIMNWEKLFSKMTSTRGHGRRWKFLIETIKQKAKLGLEHVQAYTASLEESDNEEDENKNSSHKLDDINEAEETLVSIGDDLDEEDEERKNDELEEKAGEELEGTESMVSGDTGRSEESGESPTDGSHFGRGDHPRITSPKKVRFEELVCRPPMKDADVWTDEPTYERSLFIRTFCPEGLRQLELKCSISYAGKMLKTPVLDPVIDESDDTPEERKRPQAARQGEERSKSRESSQTPSKKKRFFEFEIKLPDEVREGVLLLEEPTMAEPESIQFAVHKGRYEEIIAMTTIDFQDIKKMTLEKVYLPPNLADDDVGLKSRTNSLSASSLYAESLGDSVDIPIMADEHTLSLSSAQNDLVQGKEPIPFPLYSLHTGKSDAVQMPSGTLPLLMYWSYRPRPQRCNRQCGTMGVHDLVYDLTGIDLRETTKEDLHKEMVDRAHSVANFTPVIQEQDEIERKESPVIIEETISKSEFDQMVERHQEEIIYMQDEYEKRLQEMMASLESLQTENSNLAHLLTQRPVSVSPHQRPVSVGPRRSITPKAISPVSAKHSDNVSYPNSPAQKEDNRVPSSMAPARSATEPAGLVQLEDSLHSKPRPQPPKLQKPVKNFRIGRPLPKWGERGPQDFFERLRLWEEESKQHKEELNEKTFKEIRESLEKKLAGQHKLSRNEEMFYDALKDVSLPALFMPYKRGNVFNPRAHQYFHPSGSTEVRLTQPPSVFQLPPLPLNKLQVVNLFELSRNFHHRGPDWLIERYIEQQQPANEESSQTPAPTSVLAQITATPETNTFHENLESVESQTSFPKEEQVTS
ncbi:uncharacterized protein LOC131948723 isoform X2 [Physella acuta]|uniref:uncharacterized protein LOC131948723 isoform X2 n=1 Tax=Physella acuta TaxID=109671 RepID=UPI0027DB4181|nr:uncharacterized protein LOC131948723 isoform X2 [Physella acuta]